MPIIFSSCSFFIGVSSLELLGYCNYSLESTVSVVATSTQLLPTGNMVGAGGLVVTSQGIVCGGGSHIRSRAAGTFSEEICRMAEAVQYIFFIILRKITKFMKC